MKRLKICLLLTIIILNTGCLFEPKVTTTIEPANNLNFDYGSDVYLYDLLKITDGTITDQNYLINTDTLGEETIKINYKDSNKHKKTYEININIIDNIKPILSVPNNIYVVKNNDINLLTKVFCGDNSDRNLKCEVTNNYDISTIGNYNITFTATDTSGNISTKDSTLHVVEGISNNNNTADGTSLNYYVNNYQDINNEIGIDVSSHQQDIDYNKVKAAGINFVMIRMGYGPDSDGNMTLDNYFEENYSNAKAAGLKIGIYLYSYATTIDEANIQSTWVLDNLKDKTIDLPIAYDWESWHTFYTCGINFYDLNKIADTFLTNIKNNNYSVMNYGSKYYLENIWTLNKYDTWLAQYYTEATYNKDFKMWQISESGVVDGIDSLVDIDILKK